MRAGCLIEGQPLADSIDSAALIMLLAVLVPDTCKELRASDYNVSQFYYQDSELRQTHWLRSCPGSPLRKLPTTRALKASTFTIVPAKR